MPLPFSSRTERLRSHVVNIQKDEPGRRRARRSAYSSDDGEEEESRQLLHRWTAWKMWATESRRTCGPRVPPILLRVGVAGLVTTCLTLLVILMWFLTQSYAIRELENTGQALREQALVRVVDRCRHLFEHLYTGTMAYVDILSPLAASIAAGAATAAVSGTNSSSNSDAFTNFSNSVQGPTYHVYKTLGNSSRVGFIQPNDMFVSYYTASTPQFLFNNVTTSSNTSYVSKVDPLSGGTPIGTPLLASVGGVQALLNLTTVVVPIGIMAPDIYWGLAGSTAGPLLVASRGLVDADSGQSVGVGMVAKPMSTINTMGAPYYDGSTMFVMSEGGYLLVTSLNNASSPTPFVLATNSSYSLVKGAATGLAGLGFTSASLSAGSGEATHVRMKLDGTSFYVDAQPMRWNGVIVVVVFLLPTDALLGDFYGDNHEAILIILLTALGIFVLLSSLLLLSRSALKVLSVEVKPVGRAGEGERDGEMRPWSRSKAEKAEGSDYKAQFMANMSHELRTPMAGIIGLMDILQSDDTLSAEQMEIVSQIRRCAMALLGILNNILDLSKVEEGKLSLQTVPFDPTSELESLVEMFSVHCATSGVDIGLDIADDMPKEVVGDCSRFRQIFANLLSNSIKFTSSGWIWIRGWVLHRGPIEGVKSLEEYQAAKNDITVYFEIEDTGLGIDPSKWESVFENFVQGDTSSTRNHGGTGLGLSLVRAFVEAMGGEISILPKNGEGARIGFHVKFKFNDNTTSGGALEGATSLGGAPDRLPVVMPTLSSAREISTTDAVPPLLKSAEILLCMPESINLTIVAAWLVRKGLKATTSTSWADTVLSVEEWARGGGKTLARSGGAEPDQGIGRSPSGRRGEGTYGLLILVDLNLLPGMLKNPPDMADIKGYLARLRHFYDRGADVACLLSPSSPIAVRNELRDSVFAFIANKPLYASKLWRLLLYMVDICPSETGDLGGDVDAEDARHPLQSLEQEMLVAQGTGVHLAVEAAKRDMGAMLHIPNRSPREDDLDLPISASGEDGTEDQFGISALADGPFVGTGSLDRSVYGAGAMGGVEGVGGVQLGLLSHGDGAYRRGSLERIFPGGNPDAAHLSDHRNVDVAFPNGVDSRLISSDGERERSASEGRYEGLEGRGKDVLGGSDRVPLKENALGVSASGVSNTARASVTNNPAYLLRRRRSLEESQARYTLQDALLTPNHLLFDRALHGAGIIMPGLMSSPSGAFSGAINTSPGLPGPRSIQFNGTANVRNSGRSDEHRTGSMRFGSSLAGQALLVSGLQHGAEIASLAESSPLQSLLGPMDSAAEETMARGSGGDNSSEASFERKGIKRMGSDPLARVNSEQEALKKWLKEEQKATSAIFRSEPQLRIRHNLFPQPELYTVSAQSTKSSPGKVGRGLSEGHSHAANHGSPLHGLRGPMDRLRGPLPVFPIGDNDVVMMAARASEQREARRLARQNEPSHGHSPGQGNVHFQIDGQSEGVPHEKRDLKHGVSATSGAPKGGERSQARLRSAAQAALAKSAAPSQRSNQITMEPLSTEIGLSSSPRFTQFSSPSAGPSASVWTPNPSLPLLSPTKPASQTPSLPSHPLPIPTLAIASSSSLRSPVAAFGSPVDPSRSPLASPANQPPHSANGTTHLSPPLPPLLDPPPRRGSMANGNMPAVPSPSPQLVFISPPSVSASPNGIDQIQRPSPRSQAAPTPSHTSPTSLSDNASQLSRPSHTSPSSHSSLSIASGLPNQAVSVPSPSHHSSPSPSMPPQSTDAIANGPIGSPVESLIGAPIGPSIGPLPTPASPKGVKSSASQPPLNPSPLSSTPTPSTQPSAPDASTTAVAPTQVSSSRRASLNAMSGGRVGGSAPPAAASKSSADAIALKGLNLLVAEDTPILRRLAVALLEKAGATVRAVNDGQAALETVREWQAGEGGEEARIDAIIMDCQMPRLDGYSATQKIREDEAKNGFHVPIIALTAHAMASDEERCLACGMDAYLTKPANKNLLVATIKKFVALHPQPGLQANPE
eukprot:TRINITY_DN17065_c0_g1_i1.p1 TRINITY_DN17065_c0_g1~~TRINITY_DN17065_c0_g1_i1.p1  ORF type:complete len:2009 (+),score=286.83 TRINITY_DN17065_c0_g1_i1:645-6671(+)